MLGAALELGENVADAGKRVVAECLEQERSAVLLREGVELGREVGDDVEEGAEAPVGDVGHLHAEPMKRRLRARIAGKYRVREAKHQITGSGYAVALKLSRDAVGKVPAGAPKKPQGGDHNDAQPKAGGELEWVQTFERETGAEVLESRPGSQPLGSGDPEGAR